MAGLFGSPFLHLFLTRVMPKVSPLFSKGSLSSSSSFAIAATRILIHQLVLMPLNMLQFFMILGLLNSQRLDNITSIWETQRGKYQLAVIRGWEFWPPLLFVMYRFVPVMYQNLYMDVFGYFYAVMISYIQSHNLA